MARWSGILILCLLSFSGFKCELQDDNFIRKTPADGKVIIEKDDGKFEKTTMMCESTSDTDSTFRWFKVGPADGAEVEVTNLVGAGVVVAGGELSVSVESLNNKDVFRCKLDDEKFSDFEIIDSNAPVEKPFVGLLFRVDKFLRSYSVVENEDLKINCFVMNRTAEGFDINEISLRWYMWETVDDLSFEATAGNCSIDSMTGTKWTEIVELEDKEEPHIKFISRDGLSKAILKIEDAVKSDRRGFKCVAYNVSDASNESESCSEGVAFVRVKDKYAALWPFLGIVAEVVVLLTVILIAEKRRANKEAMEEEEEDDLPAVGSNPNDNKNTVRQRRQ